MKLLAVLCIIGSLSSCIALAAFTSNDELYDYMDMVRMDHEKHVLLAKKLFDGMDGSATERAIMFLGADLAPVYDFIAENYVTLTLIVVYVTIYLLIFSSEIFSLCRAMGRRRRVVAVRTCSKCGGAVVSCGQCGGRILEV